LPHRLGPIDGKKDSDVDENGSSEKLTNVVFDFIEQLDRQNDLSTLLGAFHDLAQEFGFVGYCIGDPTQPKQQRPGQVWGVTWAEGWKKTLRRPERHAVRSGDPRAVAVQDAVPLARHPQAAGWRCARQLVFPGRLAPPVSGFRLSPLYDTCEPGPAAKGFDGFQVPASAVLAGPL